MAPATFYLFATEQIRHGHSLPRPPIPKLPPVDSDSITTAQAKRMYNRLATTLGYGPRFLHSTGQLHKGGANNGLFIQLTADDAEDLPIPGAPYTFSVLKQAQALGDMHSLVSKQRRVLRLHMGKDVHAELARFDRMLQDAAKPLSAAKTS